MNMEQAPPPADMTRVRLAPGEVLFREGEMGDCAYVVSTGEMTITRAGADGPIHLATLGKGSLFGELALVKDVPRTATATAAGDCVLMVVKRDALLGKLDAAEPLLRIWIDHLSSRLMEMNQRLTE